MSLVLANTSLEIIHRDGVIIPILYASFSHESIDQILNDLVMKGLSKFKDTIIKNIPLFTCMDFKNFKRSGSKDTFITEMQALSKKRNSIVHHAKTATVEEASEAIAISETFYRYFFKDIIKNVGFHIHDDEKICGSKLCENQARQEIKP